MSKINNVVLPKCTDKFINNLTVEERQELLRKEINSNKLEPVVREKKTEAEKEELKRVKSLYKSNR